MPKILRVALLVLLACCLGVAQGAAPKAVKANGKLPADNSGQTRTGKASFYSQKSAGKKMASGARMDPDSNNAASRTLPLGTKARVTNTSNGKSAVVVIKDRGPYVKGRIVDLSPSTAKTIGAEKEGVVPVEVTPLEVPQSGGEGKP